MTNEELALSIRGGESEKMLKLWEQVQNFISMQAGKRARALNGYGGVTAEDLTQCGYFALIAAVRTFSPEKGLSSAGLQQPSKRSLQRQQGIEQASVTL